MDAVLFDMDGLLVDTEGVWFEVETEVVTRLGGTWGPEHQEQLVGGSWDRTVRYMLELTRADVDPMLVGQWLIDGMESRLSADVTPMPGALDLLRGLADHGVRTALVTSSLRIIADAVLKAVGREHFEVIVTADDVTCTKPHPEPYLTAAGLLSVDPGRCVALEDSPNGVASATAAGCRVVAVPGVLPIAQAPGRVVMPSLLDVDVDFLRALVR
ncbi:MULTISPECIES: HAD family hydrolase [Microbispora]|uniref:HAD family phosphatase n=2 Tax=Microbispora triticiradicis TaxID=2200763 RepID=A0ABX9L879_9ACTN|nr:MULTISPECIES: HAD family phosphatase [Microbispora]MBO4271516.1 HAD-IA family hydrolase [Microbispora triticiradicis]RGA00188.1 HAD family phosphatase [Microbispora triticiradicis]TLP59743.1 HAD family phosphatase [Microbispora fusca]GLW23199.1 hydrolase [Microbispora amethystogenes]